MNGKVPRTDDEREVFWQKVLDTIEAERALADDLADALTLAIAQANDWTREADAALARYREARQ